MRIAISSLPNMASLSLRGTLEAGHYVISKDFPSYTVDIREMTGDGDIIVDGPDARFTRLVAQRIGELAPNGGVFLAVKGPNQNDRAVAIATPTDGKSIEAVCVGVLRALDQLQKLQREPAKAQGQPFADVPEILANVVQIITARIDAAQTVTTDELSAQITRTHSALESCMGSVSQSVENSVKTHVSRVVVAERVQLFDGLMQHYARPRWWQPRYWFH